MRPGTVGNWRSAGIRLASWATVSLLALVFSSQRGYAQTPTDLVVVSSTPPPYVATNSITNSGSFVVNGSAVVTFTAGNFIKLEPGFHATAGNTGVATFQAIIGTTIGTQTITFQSIATQTAGASLTLSATTNSGLPVTFTSTTPSVCTVSGATGATVYLLSGGTCTITASQAGNSYYSAATPVSQSFTVNGAASSASLTEYIYLNGRAVAIEHTP